MDSVSYDEVLRFRKSSSKFVGDNPNLLNEAMGLHSSVGPIFGWFDNFDLLVLTLMDAERLMLWPMNFK